VFGRGGRRTTCDGEHFAPGVHAHGVSIRRSFVTVNAYLGCRNHITLTPMVLIGWKLRKTLRIVGCDTCVSMARALNSTWSAPSVTIKSMACVRGAAHLPVIAASGDCERRRVPCAPTRVSSKYAGEGQGWKSRTAVSRQYIGSNFPKCICCERKAKVVAGLQGKSSRGR
jgi:hypothetical protein